MHGLIFASVSRKHEISLGYCEQKDLGISFSCFNHEITKYGIHSFTQIALAVVRELTCRQDSAPDWLNKSSRQLVICIYRQRTNKLTKG